MEGHEVPPCDLPGTWTRRTGSVWACWCGRLWRLREGYPRRYWQRITRYDLEASDG